MPKVTDEISARDHWLIRDAGTANNTCRRGTGVVRLAATVIRVSTLNFTLSTHPCP
jgi:hypothetical protein